MRYEIELEELLDLDAVGIYTIGDNDLYHAKETLDGILSEELETSEEMLERVNNIRDMVDTEMIARGLI